MRHGDRGSATLWAAGALCAVLVLATAVIALGAAAITRHRAVAAADLAALAAAAYGADGSEQACDRARWVTDNMRVELVSCRFDGWDVLVEVSAPPPDLLAGFGAVSARARAGPEGPMNGRSDTVNGIKSRPQGVPGRDDRTSDIRSAVVTRIAHRAVATSCRLQVTHRSEMPFSNSWDTERCSQPKEARASHVGNRMVG